MSPSLWTRTVAVGIIAAASVVGNVSMSAPEFSVVRAAAPVSSAPQTTSGTDKIALRHVAVAPAVTAPLPDAKSDDVDVVPAVYARDPDVRFLFYRHVSKWM